MGETTAFNFHDPDFGGVDRKPCGVFEELFLFNARFDAGMHFYDKPVIRQLNRLSEKRRSFKRGLWGSCVATLMPHEGDSVIEASFHLNVVKDRF